MNVGNSQASTSCFLIGYSNIVLERKLSKKVMSAWYQITDMHHFIEHNKLFKICHYKETQDD